MVNTPNTINFNCIFLLCFYAIKKIVMKENLDLQTSFIRRLSHTWVASFLFLHGNSVHDTSFFPSFALSFSKILFLKKWDAKSEALDCACRLNRIQNLLNTIGTSSCRWEGRECLRPCGDPSCRSDTSVRSFRRICR